MRATTVDRQFDWWLYTDR